MTATADRPSTTESDPAGAVVRLTGDRDLARRLPLFDMCAFLGLVGLTCALVFRRPEVIALAAPAVVAIAASMALWRPPDGAVTVHSDRTRILEGEDVTITVEVTSERGLARVEVELSPSDRLAAVGALRAVTTVKPQSTTSLTFTVRGVEWGIASVEQLTVRIADRFGMFGGKIDTRAATSVTIGLPQDRVSASLDAERFRRIVGSHLSNDRGDGLEIADIRPFQPGDTARQVNWRISNRRQEPWVTLRHPDRSTTVVVIVDAHDGEDLDQRRTQRRSVNAALALCRGHLALHDGVGLLVVGHTVRWLPPKLGRNQLFQIADELVAVSNAPAASRRMYRPPAISTIPNNATVVAISPLRDPLMVALVAEIRSRGNPVSVLVPGDLTAQSSTTARRGLQVRNRTSMQARRLAVVERHAGIRMLRARGVAVVPWPNDEPVVTVLGSLRHVRRAMARSRA